MYADNRDPAASTSKTSPTGRSRPDETKTTAPTYAPPKTAHASACHAAEPQREAESQNPPAGREHRHVHVIEDEHLIAQDGEAVKIFGALLMSDGRDRRLKPGDVSLERDGNLVTEAALHARADRAEEPGGSGR